MFDKMTVGSLGLFLTLWLCVLVLQTDPVCYLHHAASVVNQENGRLPPVDVLSGGGICAQLEG